MTLHYTKVTYKRLLTKGYLQKVSYKKLLTEGYLQKVTPVESTQIFLLIHQYACVTNIFHILMCCSLD